MLSPAASSAENGSQVGSISQIQSMLQVMHNSSEANFRDVKGRLTELEVCMTTVEHKNKQLEVNPSTPTSFSSESTIEVGRKRRNPPELQVCILYL